MVLDDVFVNYDAGRTRTACDVLRQFAKQGHQLLVFTCHEHVWQMFKDIQVDTRRIPNRHGELVEELPEAPQPELLPAPVPEPVVAVVEAQPAPLAHEPEPIVELVKVKKSRPKPPPVEEPEEEVFSEEPAPVAPPTPAVTEIEYWWDTPADPTTNGAHHYEEPSPTDWLPEPEIRGRW
jgi:hypothetical protein